MISKSTNTKYELQHYPFIICAKFGYDWLIGFGGMGLRPPLPKQIRSKNDVAGRVKVMQLLSCYSRTYIAF